VSMQPGWIDVRDDVGKERLGWALGRFEHVEMFISGGGESCVVCPIEMIKGLPHYIGAYHWQHIPHLIKRLDAAGCVAVGLSQAARGLR